MNWFFIAAIAPFLFAVSNHIDKYLVSKYFKNRGAGVLVIFSSLIGFFLLPIIYLIQSSVTDISPLFAFLMIVNGFIYIVTLIPYLHALQEGDTSTVVPLYQLIPVFTYILGLVFLGETLTLLQIAASSLIMIGAVGISIDYGSGIKFKRRMFLLMTLSCFLIALNLVVFKFIAIKEGFWTTSFWEYVGFSLSAVFLIVFIKSYRNQFFSLFKNNRVEIITVNAVNEVINIIGKIILNFAALFVPVALISIINSVHPFFVLILGVILTLLFPKLVKEKIGKKYLWQKIFAIMIMFVGGYLLSI